MKECNCREKNCKEKLLRQRIDEISFAIDDMLLFLDTHPCDECALNYYEELNQKRRELKKEYAIIFGPLTIKDFEGSDCSGRNIWLWSQQPFPWEKEGGCR